MTIVFDFDNTLFNTEAFKRASFEALTKFGIEESRYQETYQKAMRGIHQSNGYSFETHFSLLHDDFSSESDRLAGKNALDNVLRTCQRFVFQGAGEMLDYFRGRGVRLVLLTMGMEKWQRVKLSYSGLDKYFDIIRIVSGDKHKTLKDFDDGGKVIIVNDNSTEMNFMHAAAPQFFYILFMHGPYASSLEFPVSECHSIDEIRSVVYSTLSLS